MNRTSRRSALGVVAAGAAFAAFHLPVAGADPTPAPAASGDCTAATLATTVSSVTANLSTYFAAHPDVNDAMIEATRQPAFVAAGQFDDYFKNHPGEADDVRAINAPLAAFKDRCGLQVSPTDALAVIGDL